MSDESPRRSRPSPLLTKEPTESVPAKRSRFFEAAGRVRRHLSPEEKSEIPGVKRGVRSRAIHQGKKRGKKGQDIQAKRKGRIQLHTQQFQFLPRQAH
jgi:hypothetical protein